MSWDLGWAIRNYTASWEQGTRCNTDLWIFTEDFEVLDLVILFVSERGKEKETETGREIVIG